MTNSFRLYLLVFITFFHCSALRLSAYSSMLGFINNSSSISTKPQFGQISDPKSKLIIQQWTTDNGLPVNNLSYMCLARNGYLWIASYDGLVRFDGFSFKIYSSDDYKVLTNNRFIKVNEDQNGNIFILSEREELFKLDPKLNHIEKVNLNISRLKVYSIFTHTDNSVLISTNDGVWKTDSNSEFKRYFPNTIKGGIVALKLDQWGKAWFQSIDNKLYRADSIRVQEIETPYLNTIRVLSFIEEKATGWIGFNRQIIHFNKSTVTIYELDNLPTDESILSLYKIPNENRLIISTANNGLFETSSNIPATLKKINQIRNKSILYKSFVEHKYFGKIFPNKNGLYDINFNSIYTDENLNVKDVLVDKEQNIWITTDGNGLLQLKKNLFTTLNFGDSRESNNIYPVFEDSTSTIWVGSYGKSIFSIKNGIKKNYSFGNGNYGDKYLTTIAELNDGSLVFGGISSVIYKLKDDEVSLINLPKKENQYVYTIFEDSKKQLWIGSDKGLYLLNALGSQIYNVGDQVIVRGITEAPDSSLWFSTIGSGIIRLKNDYPLSIYSQTEFQHSIIRSITIEKGVNHANYTAWVTTEGVGLHKIDVINGELKPTQIIRKNDGLLEETIHNLLIDDTNRFWMSTNKGLFTVEKNQLLQFFNGKQSNVSIQSYFEADGLPNNEFNGGYQQTAIRLSTDEFAFANQKGLVVFNPKDFKRNDYNPPVFIDFISLNDSLIYTVNDEIIFNQNQRDFTIHFASLSLKNASKNQFKYRLLPEDKNWKDNGTSRSVVYQRLDAGDYTFEVVGSNNDGVYSSEIARVSFTIEPFWYENVLFYIFLFLVLLSSSYALFRLRIVQLNQRAQNLQFLIQKRTEELEIERDYNLKKSKQVLDVLDSRNQLLSKLSADMHQPLDKLQNPLMELKQLLNNDSFEKENTLLNQVIDNSEELDLKIKQVLDLSKIHEGKFNVKPTEINLSQVLHLFIEQFKFDNSIPSNQLNDIDAALNLYAKIDQFQFINAFSHLFSFLLKTLEQPVHLKVDLKKLSDEKGCISIDAQSPFDNNIPYIISLFNDISNPVRINSEYSITIIYINELLKANNFTISYQKESNKIVTLILQVDLITPSTKPQEEVLFELVDDINDDDIEIVKPIALCVDDFKPFRVLAAESLKTDFTVMVAETVDKALEMMNETVPDVIISDYLMPNKTGLDFVKIVRSNPLTNGIPFVILTAITENITQLESLENGVDLFVNKPFKPSVLAAQVKSLLSFKTRLRSKEIQFNSSIRSTSPLKNKPDSDFLESLQSLIENHLVEPDFNVEDLANMLNTDRSVLFRKVKKITGKSPSTIIQEMRIQKALKMLQSGDGNVSEIAYACGYNSLSYFSQAFKTHTGKSPSDWLNELSV